MATIDKRGDSWRAQVRVTGFPAEVATFAKKAEATAWATAREADLRATKRGKTPDKTFGDLLMKYKSEVADKKGDRWEQLRIDFILRTQAISKVKLCALAAPHVAAWRDGRLIGTDETKPVAEGTVRREWNILSRACTLAVKEWHWLHVNPFKDVERPASPEARDRRISSKEIERMKFVCGYEPDTAPATSVALVCATWLFAIETGMRAGEILALVPADIFPDKKYLRVRAEEKGAGKTRAARRNVPLTDEALRILKQVEGQFLISKSSLDALFRRYRDKAGIDGMTFHDTRHEAITRLSKKMDVLALARSVGHQNLKELMTYYNESAEDIAAGF